MEQDVNGAMAFIKSQTYSEHFRETMNLEGLDTNRRKHAHADTHTHKHTHIHTHCFLALGK